MPWSVADRNDTINVLVTGGLSPVGATALASRWEFVESAGNPVAVNPSSGAFGLAQWLGSRKTNLFSWADQNNVDPYSRRGQTLFALHELNTTESRAAGILKSDNLTSFDYATGASIFERAEGYNPTSGLDNFTLATDDKIPDVYADYENAAALSYLQSQGLAEYGDFGDMPPLDELPEDVRAAIEKGEFGEAGKKIAKAGEPKETKVAGQPGGSGSIPEAIDEQSRQLKKNTEALVANQGAVTSAVTRAASGIATGTQSLFSNLFTRGALIFLGALFILAAVLGLAFGNKRVQQVATAVATKKVVT